jgi:hypothetical protein
VLDLAVYVDGVMVDALLPISMSDDEVDSVALAMSIECTLYPIFEMARWLA